MKTPRPITPRAKSRPVQLSADTARVIALAEVIRRKFVNFATLPSRDPKTGTFTGPGGAVTAAALRKAWRAPRVLTRIAPRLKTKTPATSPDV